MRVKSDYTVCNAKSQINHDDSVYNYWASMLSLRRQYKELIVYGSFQLVDAEHPTVFAIERRFQRRRLLVTLNWSSKSVDWEAPRSIVSTFEHGILLRCNYSRTRGGFVNGSMSLSPWEAIVILEESSLL